ncbi:helix-turn-helix domain-containing protein [Nocardia sp. BMG51109]|uniref:helix-turn-helix domain-containing protein n=1 Tax=Nocardia sp. BMG51109 TaxID=1056816 RepID=UPI000467620C|nr:helix-turn-helix domain-containing protein [Nocardia sp. BMG51109]
MTTNWDAETALRVGRAVKQLRESERPKLSAAKLAQRTTECGYALSKAQISDLELGRKKTITVPELLILATALGVWPAWLLYPDLPHGRAEVVPGRDLRSIDAVDWLGGRYWFQPEWTGPDHIAQEKFDLPKASRKLRDLDEDLKTLRNKAIWSIRRDPKSAEEATRAYQAAVEDIISQRTELAAAIRSHGGTVDDLRTELPTDRMES